MWDLFDIFFHIRQQQRPPRLCQPQLLATLLLPPFQPLAPRKKDPFLTPPLMVILIEKEKFWCHRPLQLKKKDVDNVLLPLFQVTNLQIWSCLPRPAADKTRCLTSTNIQIRTNLQIQIKSQTSIRWESTFKKIPFPVLPIRFLCKLYERGWTARNLIARQSIGRHFWQEINCSTQNLSTDRIQLILAQLDLSSWHFFLVRHINWKSQFFT